MADRQKILTNWRDLWYIKGNERNALGRFDLQLVASIYLYLLSSKLLTRMFTTTSKFYVKNSKDIKLGRYYYNVLRILVSRKIELAESKRYIKDSILANQ